MNGREALWVLDRHDRIVVWSRGAADLLGYASEDVIGGCFTQLHVPDDLDDAGDPGEVARLLIRGGSLQGHRTRLVSREREEVPVSLAGMRLTDTRGHVSGTLFVAHLIPAAGANGTSRRHAGPVPQNLRDAVPLLDGPKPLLGSSKVMRTVMETVARVARSDASVVISGESGTGKELLAHAIHHGSPRRCCPFVTINCAAIPEHLLESELFGHERGAFTGAEKRRIGRFERASCGTVFLDEIGDMALGLQAKILRALDCHEIERVGGDRTIPVDLRVISASNRSLRSDIAEGRFREDLYYRLAVVVVELPPLRDRGDDVYLLAEHFLSQYAERNGKPVPEMASGVLKLLARYPWPGNVRELKNAMEHALLMAPGRTIHLEHLPASIVAFDPATVEADYTGTGSDRGTLRDGERRRIVHVMASVRGNQKRAAEILGIHRNTLRTKLRQHGLST